MGNVVDKITDILSSAPVKVEELIRIFNIELEKNAELHKNILGEIRKLDGHYKISIQKNDHYFRKRFTMAHELAHFFLHRDKIGEGVDDNVAYRSTEDGNFYNRMITPKEETEANQLAASLLMPEHLLIPYINGQNSKELDTLANELSNKFQVSPAAMKIRLNSLKSKKDPG